jgi:hypothetical protein
MKPRGSLLLLFAGAASAGPVSRPSLASVRPFGGGIFTGFNGHIFARNETSVFVHKVTNPGEGTAATMTFLFMLAGKDVTGRFTSDNVIFRYYLDGAANASLEFKPGAAAGTMVHLEDLEYVQKALLSSLRALSSSLRALSSSSTASSSASP